MGEDKRGGIDSSEMLLSVIAQCVFHVAHRVGRAERICAELGGGERIRCTAVIHMGTVWAHARKR